MIEVSADRASHEDLSGRGVGGQAAPGVEVGHDAEPVVGVDGPLETLQRDVVQ